jgi:hypothetical protein
MGRLYWENVHYQLSEFLFADEPIMPIMQFSYQLTAEDIRAGRALNEQVGPLWLHRLIMDIAWIIIGFIVVLCIAMIIHFATSFISLILPLFLLLVCAILFFLNNNPHFVLKQNERLRDERKVRLYKDRIEQTTYYASETLILAECLAYKANSHTILLYASRNYFIIFRDRYFESAEQFDQFRMHLMTHLKPLTYTQSIVG